MTTRTILELVMVVSLAGMVVSVMARLVTGRLRPPRCASCGGPASRAYPLCRHCGSMAQDSPPEGRSTPAT